MIEFIESFVLFGVNRGVLSSAVAAESLEMLFDFYKQTQSSRSKNERHEI